MEGKTEINMKTVSFTVPEGVYEEWVRMRKEYQDGYFKFNRSRMIANWMIDDMDRIHVEWEKQGKEWGV